MNVAAINGKSQQPAAVIASPCRQFAMGAAHGCLPSLPAKVCLFAVYLPALQQAVIVAAIGFIVCVFILVGSCGACRRAAVGLRAQPRAVH